MSLNFDYSGISAISQLLENYPNEVESVIWHTMSLGINTLPNDAAVDKFYTRYVMKQMAEGVKAPDFLSYNDVWMMKGLKTNASSITDAAFSRQIKIWFEATASFLLEDAKDANKA